MTEIHLTGIEVYIFVFLVVFLFITALVALWGWLCCEERLKNATKRNAALKIQLNQAKSELITANLMAGKYEVGVQDAVHK